MHASPVCNPGDPDAVLVEATPAVPDGVSSPVVAAGTTVTAVMVDLLPFGNVLVWMSVLVSLLATCVIVELD